MSALALVSVATPALAEVVSSNPNGFHLRHTVDLAVPPDAALSAFARVEGWWDPGHTYSGKASNLSLSLAPGSCFCERLPNGGGVEHMRVAFVQPGERLVLTGALGPLLFEAANGVMDVKADRTATGSRLTMDYKVAGFASGAADKLAPLVDQVLGAQIKRYRSFAAAQRSTR